MKAEINQRIASLLENPEIESVRVEVRTAFEVYKDAREKDVTAQRAAFDEIEQAPALSLAKSPSAFLMSPTRKMPATMRCTRLSAKGRKPGGRR